MPKATKKKAEKAADFKKAKLKLGKGKKAASNATDTSFKARSIALPSQKPLARALQSGPDDDEAGPSTSAVPTTASGLTLDDVLIQVRHANAGVRRESIKHLKDVLIAGANYGVALGERHGEVAKVMRGVGGLISDDDASVRKALHAFLAWYLPRLPHLALRPYLPLLQLQIASALSHIFPATRIDACKLVELLLETHSEDVIGNWPARSPHVASSSSSLAVPTSGSTIFEGLRLSAGLGEEKGASTQAGFKLSAGNKLVILRAIKTFIVRALDGTTSDGIAFATSSKPQLGEWNLNDLTALSSEQWSLQTSGNWGVVDAGKNVSRQEEILANEDVMEELSQTYLSLHSLLLSTFMEAAPSAFPPSSAATSTTIDDVSLNLCAVCAELEWVFARSFLSPETLDPPNAAKLRSSFSEFLKRMTTWFPFNKRAEAPSEASSVLFNLSLNFAKLATALAPKAPPIGLPKRREGWRYRVRAIDAAWAGLQKAESGRNNKAASDALSFRLTAEWIDVCLEPSTDALAPSLGVQAYCDLLPVISSHVQRPGDTLETFLQAVLRQASTSGNRKASDAFLIALLWTHEDRFSMLPFFVPTTSAARPLFASWITSAPRTLWELAAKDPEASEAHLRFLLDLGTRAESFESPFSLVDPALFPGIAGKLVPFFHLVHPSRGAVEGPWAKLPTKTQRLALDVGRVWAPMDTRLASAIVAAVRGTWAEEYWGRISPTLST